MNIFNNEIFENQEILVDFFTEINNFIELNIKIQEEYQKIFMNYINKISDIPLDENIKNSANIIVKFLTLIKSNFELSKECNDKLYELKTMNESFFNNHKNIEEINDFFIKYNDIQNFILKKNLEINKFLNYSTEFTNLCFNSETQTNDTKISEIYTTTNNEFQNGNYEKKPKFEDDTENDNIKQNTIVNEASTIELSNENTLIISEIQGKVILPYTTQELQNILDRNKDKYSNYNEIIENKFTIPYTNFKNPILARFKESFKLVRTKSHGSIKEAFDLGIELLFKHNLHPAIISACRNLDELDIYLSYLEENQTSKFNCFKIKFDIAPIATKEK
jgi:hypothetical protein